MATKPVRTLIFDIGDVLCSWSPANTTIIPRQLLKEFRSSPTWYEYNCGQIGEEECYAQLGTAFSVEASAIAEAFSQARDSQSANEDMIAAIQELKAAYKGSLHVYAMSNISRPDWEILKAKPFDWSIFDRVFTSSEAGMCKPELRFYNHVLAAIQTSPDAVVFIDDKAENVLAARSLGIRSIQFDNSTNVYSQIINILGNPVTRGNEFLARNARRLDSETNSGHQVRDNFAQLLILEATGNLGLIELENHERTWNYFVGKPFGTTMNYPDDVDTTSIALMLLPIDRDVAHSVMDEMLRLRTADGIIMTYFDAARCRTDPTVCVNVVRLFYQYGRGHQPELQPTKDWICNVLFHSAYLDGTRYYQSPDIFLFFLSRLLADNQSSDIYRSTAALVRERLQERINTPGDAMELAMRILACHSLGIRDTTDMNRLLAVQQADGSWETGWLCHYGKTKVKLGNRGLTTALAINAAQALNVPSATRPSAFTDEAISMLSREPSPIEIEVSG